MKRRSDHIIGGFEVSLWLSQLIGIVIVPAKIISLQITHGRSTFALKGIFFTPKIYTEPLLMCFTDWKSDLKIQKLNKISEDERIREGKRKYKYEIIKINL